MNPGGLGILDKNLQKVQRKIQTAKLINSSLGLFEPNFYILQPVHDDTAIGCWISASHIFLFNQWKWKFWIWGSVLVLEEINTITSACSWVLVLNIESCMQQWGYGRFSTGFRGLEHCLFQTVFGLFIFNYFNQIWSWDRW